MSTITEQESLFLQSVANTSLFAELSNHNFLKSSYFDDLTFVNEQCKQILAIFGLGNPAMMQIMLYALLIIPRETLSRESKDELDKFINQINPLVSKLVEEETHSTYAGEDLIENINFFRHVRNAVAHSKCAYSSLDSKNYVTFSDKDEKRNSCCDIKIECYKVGSVLMELQKLIMEYYNTTHNK